MADPDTIVQQADPKEAVAEVVRAVKRNGLRVIFTTLVFLMIGLGVAMIWPNKYESSTQFVLREWHIVDNSAILGDLQDIPLPKKLKTLENEMRSRKRIDMVLNELQWVEWLETAGKPSRRRDLALKIAENLKVEMDADVTGAHNITLAFQWTSPRKAADFVNRLRNIWIELTVQTYRKRLEDSKERAEAIYMERDIAFRDSLDALQKFERDFEVPSLMNAEVNNTMKAELMIKLADANAQHLGAVRLREQLDGELAGIEKEIELPLPPEDPEHVAATTIHEQRVGVLEQVMKDYTPAHPRYVKAQEDVDEAHAHLHTTYGGPIEEQFATTTNPDYFTKAELLASAQAQEREMKALVDSLEDELAKVDDRLGRLPMVMVEQARLLQEKALAEELLGLARNEIQPLRERVTQLRSSNLLNTVAGTDALVSTGPFEILDVGVEPEDPVMPIHAIILAVTLLLGLGMGAMGPVLQEMTRSSFGTAKEVSRTLGVPVLGAVDMIMTQRDVRARTVQQALTVATMVLVLVALGTALYVYAFHKDQLPQELVRTLRELSMALT